MNGQSSPEEQQPDPNHHQNDTAVPSENYLSLISDTADLDSESVLQSYVSAIHDALLMW